MGLGAGSYGASELAYKDKSAETGTSRVYGDVLDDGNWVAQQGLWDAYWGAVNAITLGVLVHRDYGNTVVVDPVNLPASNGAQRENKLLVRYYDGTTLKRYLASIPTIDLSILTFETDAHDFVSKTTGALVIAFVSAFQNFAVAPETGNACLIESLEFVGRNS